MPNAENNDAVNLSQPAASPKLLATTQAIQRYLVVQPKLDALSTAQAALLPLLLSSGHEIWDAQVLRHESLPSSNHLRYRLNLQDSFIVIDIWAVGQGLERSPARDTLPESPFWGVRSSGSHWQIIDFSSKTPEVLSVSIYDKAFPEVIDRLFSKQAFEPIQDRIAGVRQLLGANVIAEKLEQLIAKLGADTVRQYAQNGPEELLALLQEHDLLKSTEALSINLDNVHKAIEQSVKATQLGFVRSAPPLSNITLADVQRHAEAVKNLRGQLEASFDNTPVGISSRSSLYYVLAALAVQYGREDAVPADDLIRPPQSPPDEKRYRPLGKPGWYLELGGDLVSLEQAVNHLLDSLNLRHRFIATQRGKLYPPPE